MLTRPLVLKTVVTWRNQIQGGGGGGEEVVANRTKGNYEEGVDAYNKFIIGNF